MMSMRYKEKVLHICKVYNLKKAVPPECAALFYFLCCFSKLELRKCKNFTARKLLEMTAIYVIMKREGVIE